MKSYSGAAMSALASAVLLWISLSQTGCTTQAESQEESHGEAEHQRKIVATSPLKKDVTSTQPYVCQIHSCKHIEVRALMGGYLAKILVKEGQAVKKDELMFKILPTLYEAKLKSEEAEVQRFEISLQNAKNLAQKGIVSGPEVALKEAELAKAKAKVTLAQAELDFTDVKAPFDGIVDRQRNQLGSLISEGDMLTTLSDNNLMWVYFNVPEKDYLAYKSDLDKDKAAGSDNRLQIELKLANGKIFPQKGKIGAIEADFNNTTGNIAFRADFANPDGLLRNGQTGTVLIHRILNDALVIPQRAIFEILAKRYVFVIDEDNVVRQRDIEIDAVLEDIFVIKEGLEEGDKIILEGLRQVRDGEKVEYDFQDPEEVLTSLKYHAE